MKKIIYLFLASWLGFSSCDDTLDRFPLDSFSPENYFNNELELKTYSNQFYWNFPGAANGYGEAVDVVIPFTLSPEVQGTRTIPNSGGGWDWGGLRNINLLLKYSHRCSDTRAREQYDGLARFFRAYFYFNKIKRFGDVPWYDKVLDSDSEDLYKPRDNRQYVFSKMIEDLDYAIAKLPTTIENVYRVNGWTARALKSRVCLFEGTFRKYHGLDGWEEILNQCAEVSREMIDQSPYSIWTGSEKPYRDLFASIEAVGQEVILARDYDKNKKVLHDANYNAIGTTYGRPGMNKKIVNSYLMKDGSRFTDKEGYQTMGFVDEMKDRDPRVYQTIVTPNYTRINESIVRGPDFQASTTGYQIIKWVTDADGDGYQGSYNDFILFRIAEVYLNYAEAKAELGTLTQGDLDISIKKIRDRVGMPNIDMAAVNANPDPYLESPRTGYRNVTGNNKGIILEIRRERTIELCLEGFRYDDIMRWKEGKVFEQEFYGMYFSELNQGSGENRYGVYDMNDGVLGDEAFVDICVYTGTKPKIKGMMILNYYKLNDIFSLANGLEGNIICHPLKDNQRVWREERDYLYPIPIEQRTMTNGALKQNPGWDDQLPY